MVTLPAAAATDVELVRGLVRGGMDVARINCAHDSAREWVAMAASVRHAAAAEGRAVKVLMDLAGPKLRTGPIAGLPPLLKLKPYRDALGAIVTPLRLGLRRAGSADAVPGAVEHAGVDRLARARAPTRSTCRRAKRTPAHRARHRRGRRARRRAAHDLPDARPRLMALGAAGRRAATALADLPCAGADPAMATGCDWCGAGSAWYGRRLGAQARCDDTWLRCPRALDALKKGERVCSATGASVPWCGATARPS
jgi:pyruvate kinase